MATRVTREVVCDRCGRAPARRWRVERTSGAKRTGDLCASCEAELLEFLEPFKRVFNNRKMSRPMATPEEIREMSH